MSSQSSPDQVTIVNYDTIAQELRKIDAALMDKVGGEKFPLLAEEEPHFASSPFQGPLHREWVDSPKINTVICPMKEFPELAVLGSKFFTIRRFSKFVVGGDKERMAGTQCTMEFKNAAMRHHRGRCQAALREFLEEAARVINHLWGPNGKIRSIEAMARVPQVYSVDQFRWDPTGIDSKYWEAVTFLTPWTMSQILYMLVDPQFAERACHRLIGWHTRLLSLGALYEQSDPEGVGVRGRMADRQVSILAEWAESDSARRAGIGRLPE